jgi:hypothetical protein
MNTEDSPKFECSGYDANGGFYFRSGVYGEIRVDAKHMTKPEGILRVFPDMDYWLEQIPARDGKGPDWLRLGCVLIQGCYNLGERK